MKFAQGRDYSERLDYFDEVSSTQDFLKEHYSTRALGRNFHWVRSAFQTAGRGRMGRKWDAVKGNSLLCSVAFNAEIMNASGARTQFLPLVALVVLCDALKTHFPSVAWEQIVAKWPNDLLWKNSEGALQKLSGILVETKGKNLIIVGWGINLRGPRPLATATFIEEILGSHVSENQVHTFFYSLRSSFYGHLSQWSENATTYEKKLILDAQEIWMKGLWGRELLIQGDKLKAIGLEADGSLRCLSTNGEVRVISSANNVEMETV